MKYAISVLFLISTLSVFSQTVYHYKHVYDIDENGVKFDYNIDKEPIDLYLVFNSSKSQFYVAKNKEGMSKERYERRSGTYKYEKTVNNVHYFYQVCYEPKYSRYSGKQINKYDPPCKEYVYFSNDFSKINWTEMSVYANTFLTIRDRDFIVYEKYIETKERQAPNQLY